MREEYVNYTAEDFLEEDAFIRWQRDRATAKERRAWQRWLLEHPEMQKRVEEAMRQLDRLQFRESDSSQIDRQVLWQQIDAATQDTSRTARSKARIRRLPILIAAATVLLALSFFFLFPRTTTVATAMAEQQVYTLPDNSRVTINAKSSISLRRDRWPEQRNLRLRGEAYFDVEQGQRFIVQTSLGAVEVLGTRFNVFQRDTFFEVRCYEGRVGVRNVQLDTMQFELRAGEGVRRKAGSLQRFTFENRAQLATWTQGTFRYDRTALAVVLEELERQFDVEIRTTEDVQLSKDYSGFFSLDSLEEALYSVCWPMGLNYRIEGDNVEISKRQEK